MRNILHFFTYLNIAFQIVYLTLGRYTDLGKAIIIFAVFRPEYWVVSGLVALVTICLLLISMIRSKNLNKVDIIMIALNLEYLLYYSKMIALQ